MTKPYRTVVADPPWSYNDSASAGLRGSIHKYDCMTVERIKSLGTASAVVEPQIADFDITYDAHLYLWCTNAFVLEAHEIMLAWGFNYKTMLTWVKPGIGMGSWYRNNTEHVLFGVRGKAPPRVRNLPTAFHAKRRKHSEKPEEFFKLVEAMSHGPYLELFARCQRPGWTCWGNELPETK